MKNFLTIVALIFIGNIKALALQELSLTEKVKALNTVKMYGQHLMALDQGDATARFLIEELWETNANQVFNDLPGQQGQMTDLTKYLTQVQLIKDQVEFSFNQWPAREEIELYVEEKYVFGKPERVRYLVIPVSKYVNGKQVDNHIIIRASTNKIVNIYSSLPDKVEGWIGSTQASGKPVYIENMIPYLMGGLYGYASKTRELIVQANYEKANRFSENRALVMNRGKYGFIDDKGKEIIPLVYDSAADFYNGFAKVRKDGRFGFVDFYGSESIPVQYEGVTNYYNGYARVMKNGNWGLIDTRGIEILPFVYEDLGNVFDQKIWVKKTGKWGMLMINGEMKIGPKYENYKFLGKNTYAVYDGRKWGVVDSNGKQRAPFIYEKTDYESEGLMAVKNNNKWGFVDLDGQEVIPCIYMGGEYPVSRFSEGLASVKIKDRYGAINKRGEMVINPVFDNLSLFKEGRASVTIDNKMGFIDAAGNIIVPVSYDWVGDFSEGLAFVATGGPSIFDMKFGYVDVSGHMVVPMKFQVANGFRDGLASVSMPDEHKMVYADRDGNIFSSSLYRPHSTETGNRSSASVQDNTVWGLVFSKGLNISSQKTIIRPYLADNEIEEAWNEGYYISQLSYGNGDYVAVLSKPKGGDRIKQTYIRQESFPLDKIKTMGRWVSSIVYDGYDWLVFFTDTSGFNFGKIYGIEGQRIITMSYIDEARLKEEARKGYFVTSMARANGTWYMVISKIKYIDAEQKVLSANETGTLQKELNKGNYIVRMCFGGGKAIVVLSKRTGITSQSITARAGDLPQDKLNENYSVKKRIVSSLTSNQ